jgi:hypothetical protein
VQQDPQPEQVPAAADLLARPLDLADALLQPAQLLVERMLGGQPAQPLRHADRGAGGAAHPRPCAAAG